MSAFSESFAAAMDALAASDVTHDPDRASRDLRVEDVLDAHLEPAGSLIGVSPSDLAPLPDSLAADSHIAARVAQLVWLRTFETVHRSTVLDAEVAGNWLTANQISLEHQRWQSQTLGLRNRAFVQSLQRATLDIQSTASSFAQWFYAGQLRAVFRFADLGEWTRSSATLRDDPLNRALALGAELALLDDGSIVREHLRAEWGTARASITARYVLINSVFFARPFGGQADLLIEWSRDLERSGEEIMDAYGWGRGGDGVVLGYRARGLVRKAGQEDNPQRAASYYEEADKTISSALQRMPIGDPTTDLALFTEQFERERQSILFFRAVSERLGVLEDAARRADRSILTTVEIVGLFTAVIGFTFGSVNLLAGFKDPSTGDRLLVLGLFGLFMALFAAILVVAINTMRSRPRER